MDKMDLKKYGITGVTEIVYNPSYDELFREETKKGLRGYEKGQLTDMGAVNVMTGVYTGRSPKDKFFVMDETTKDTIIRTRAAAPRTQAEGAAQSRAETQSRSGGGVAAYLMRNTPLSSSRFSMRCRMAARLRPVPKLHERLSATAWSLLLRW